MMLGIRLKEIREAKNLSQGDIEKLSGIETMLCVTSREWAYGSGGGDVGEAGTGARGSDVQALLCRRRCTLAASTEARRARRVGQQR
jgi:transcriptional regulator with XRE-family HTH domain